ncbi:Pentatricopeptide repeat [Quillaja saponaria]|uniref:Pentatricopeptide repeat n=1 Tax=Quillaja saponaria TaxID=32244 RepID=A0AAD7KWE8_QUISA|nr:Pentatricopeptide repeat [Quillaja saponaria]
MTFLSGLSACAHAGLVDKGSLAVVDEIEAIEGLQQKIWSKIGSICVDDGEAVLTKATDGALCLHMIDLFGHAGCLHQAWEFVRKMPERPNSDVRLLLTCICPCCLCVTILVEFALSLIKAPITVMEWFISKIPC